jgi:hypothetical protein
MQQKNNDSTIIPNKTFEVESQDDNGNTMDHSQYGTIESVTEQQTTNNLDDKVNILIF